MKHLTIPANQYYLGSLVAAVLCMGCGQNSGASDSPKAVSPNQRVLQPVKTAEPNLKTYLRKPVLPKIRLSPRPTPEVEVEAPKTKQETVRMVVRIEGSGIARGGSAADWPGLKPGERFFRAVWSKDPGKTYRFRIKAATPDKVVHLLGRKVVISGHWLNQGKATAINGDGRSKIPQAIDLRHRKGQDLVEAAQKARQEFIDRQVDGIDKTKGRDKGALLANQSAVVKLGKQIPALWGQNKPFTWLAPVGWHLDGSSYI